MASKKKRLFAPPHYNSEYSLRQRGENWQLQRENDQVFTVEHYCRFTNVADFAKLLKMSEVTKESGILSRLDDDDDDDEEVLYSAYIHIIETCSVRSG